MSVLLNLMTSGPLQCIINSTLITLGRLSAGMILADSVYFVTIIGNCERNMVTSVVQIDCHVVRASLSFYAFAV